MIAAVLSVGLIGGALAGLVAYYMRIDLARPVQLSTGRFLRGLSPTTRRSSRWRLAQPLKSWLFLLRAAILVLLLLAASRVLGIAGPVGPTRLGVRFVLDTSYSMAARDGSGTRFDALRRELAATLAQIDRVAAADTCIEVVLVDDEVRVVVVDDLRTRPGLAAPRRRGGAAGRLTAAAFEQSRSAPACAPTHAVVVTDQTRPATAGADGIALVWRQVGLPALNVGFREAQAVAKPLTDETPELVVTLDGALAAARGRTVSATGPNGGAVELAQPDFSTPGPWRVRVKGYASGAYRLALTGEDAFDGDDQVIVTLTRGSARRIDWRLERPAMPPGLASGAGDPTAPLVAPLGATATLDRTAVLTAGRWGRRTDGRIGAFHLGHPVMQDLDLDVLEKLLPEPIAALPPGFLPLVADADGRPLIAVRQVPRAAIVPLPESEPTAAAHSIGWVVTLNALRWVADAEIATARLEFTTPDGELLPFGHYEHGVDRPLGTSDDLSGLAPVHASGVAKTDDAGVAAAVRWLLVLALLLLALERVRGVSWGWSR